MGLFRAICLTYGGPESTYHHIRFSWQASTITPSLHSSISSQYPNHPLTTGQAISFRKAQKVWYLTKQYSISSLGPNSIDKTARAKARLTSTILLNSNMYRHFDVTRAVVPEGSNERQNYPACFMRSADSSITRCLFPVQLNRHYSKLSLQHESLINGWHRTKSCAFRPLLKGGGLYKLESIRPDTAHMFRPARRFDKLTASNTTSGTT